MSGMSSLYFNTGRAKVAPVAEVIEAQPQPQNVRTRTKCVTTPKKVNHKGKAAKKKPSKAADTPTVPKRNQMSLRSRNKS